jgi:hypothetical protein
VVLDNGGERAVAEGGIATEPERERGRGRLAVGALCVAMVFRFLLALAVPFLRDFYEL